MVDPSLVMFHASNKRSARYIFFAHPWFETMEGEFRPRRCPPGWPLWEKTFQWRLLHHLYFSIFTLFFLSLTVMIMSSPCLGNSFMFSFLVPARGGGAPWWLSDLPEPSPFMNYFHHIWLREINLTFMVMAASGGIAWALLTWDRGCYSPRRVDVDD